MANYVANGPISVPLSLPGVKADVNLGGLAFSYKYGFFYSGVRTELPVKLPPEFSTGPMS